MSKEALIKYWLDTAEEDWVTAIDLDNDQLSHLTEINTFNIRARYDDYRRSFYKKATKKYAQEYFSYAKEFQLWIKKMYQKK